MGISYILTINIILIVIVNTVMIVVKIPSKIHHLLTSLSSK